MTIANSKVLFRMMSRFKCEFPVSRSNITIFLLSSEGIIKHHVLATIKLRYVKFYNFRAWHNDLSLNLGSEI